MDIISNYSYIHEKARCDAKLFLGQVAIIQCRLKLYKPMVTDLVSSLPVLEEELLEVEANMYEEVGDKRDIAQIRTM